MKKNIRIVDIAKKAGVSIGTVDRVLHHRGDVSEVTKEKILKIVEEVDYHPNIFAKTLASKRDFVIASLTPWFKDRYAYWAKPQQGIIEAIEQIKQFGVTLKQFYFKMEDTESFTSEAEKILELSPDGVVLAPWAKREALKFIQSLDERKIPYVFIDSTLKETNPISFVVQNSYKSGYLAAKLLDYGINERSLILLVHITKELDNVNHLLQREKGFLEYFESRKEKMHTIVKIKVTGEENELKEKIKEKGIGLSSVDAVFITNSKVHHAVNCFKELTKSPKIVGYDLIPRNIELLKKGKVDFLICQKPEKQGFIATNLLFDHIVRKQKVKLENYTPIDIVTKENIEYYSSF
ncbi:MAG: LacI family DNA-binding transcriptional regulator [Bacteroidota bacterium]|nr:LacI family DNA-binding transcriptional regulator [Bacteroidota bacterium]